MKDFYKNNLQIEKIRVSKAVFGFLAETEKKLIELLDDEYTPLEFSKRKGLAGILELIQLEIKKF